jgi:hypothetical protein
MSLVNTPNHREVPCAVGKKSVSNASEDSSARGRLLVASDAFRGRIDGLHPGQGG